METLNVGQTVRICKTSDSLYTEMLNVGQTDFLSKVEVIK